MKKIFTLIAVAFMALTVNAEDQVLVSFAASYPSEPELSNITISGTTEINSGKIHTNTDAFYCIKFINNYSTEGAFNNNVAVLSTDYGFRKGDVLTVAGFYSNTDTSKVAKVSIVTVDENNACTVVWTSDRFINGRLSSAEPVEQSYTLEDDMNEIILGRTGNTATFLYSLKVVRPEASAIENINAAPVAKKVVKVLKNGQLTIGNYNIAGQRVK